MSSHNSGDHQNIKFMFLGLKTGQYCESWSLKYRSEDIHTVSSVDSGPHTQRSAAGRKDSTIKLLFKNNPCGISRAHAMGPSQCWRYKYCQHFHVHTLRWSASVFVATGIATPGYDITPACSAGRKALPRTCGTKRWSDPSHVIARGEFDEFHFFRLVAVLIICRWEAHAALSVGW